MSNWTARIPAAYAFPAAGPAGRGRPDGSRRTVSELCGCRTPLSTRSASGGSPWSRGSSPPTSWRPPSRPSGCTSRRPRTTSPIRPATPSTPRSQFAGVEEFPYRSWDLNRLAFHPDLVDAAERYLGTTELHLYKVELWAKYAGAVNYDQPLHRDYGSHSLVVPRPRRPLPAADHVHLPLRRHRGGRPDPDRPLRARARTCPSRRCTSSSAPWPIVEVSAVGPAGSLLVYRTDILHRGSDFTGAGRSRFSILADYQVRGTTWGGKMAWPKQSPQRWAKLMPQCTVRERDLFGFPRPGDDYWNEQTLADVALRYPGMDMTPYRQSGAGAAGRSDDDSPSRSGRSQPLVIAWSGLGIPSIARAGASSWWIPPLGSQPWQWELSHPAEPVQRPRHGHRRQAARTASRHRLRSSTTSTASSIRPRP